MALLTFKQKEILAMVHGYRSVSRTERYPSSRRLYAGCSQFWVFTDRRIVVGGSRRPGSHCGL